MTPFSTILLAFSVHGAATVRSIEPGESFRVAAPPTWHVTSPSSPARVDSVPSDDWALLTASRLDTVISLLDMTREAWKETPDATPLKCAPAPGGPFGMTAAAGEIARVADGSARITQALAGMHMTSKQLQSALSAVCEAVMSSSMHEKLASMGAAAPLPESPKSVIGKNIVFVRSHSSLLERLATAGLVANGVSLQNGASSRPAASVSVPTAGVTVPMRTLGVPGSLADGNPAVDVMVNGRGPFRMMVETGMGNSTITPRALAAARLVASGGEVDVDSLSIGNAQLRKFALSLRETGMDSVDGILGLDAFQSFVLTLDYPQRLVRIEADTLPAPNGNDVLALHDVNPGGYLGFDLIVAGRTVPSFLDTQSGGLFIAPPSVADSTPFAAPPVVTGISEGPAIGRQQTRTGRIDGDIKMGPLTFVRPVVDIIPMPVGLVAPVWNVGTKALRECILTIDQQRHRIRVTSPKTHVEGVPRRSIGMTMAGTQTGVVVSEVLYGSVAAEAGLRQGDAVVSIDGKSPGAVDFSSLDQGTRQFPIVIRRGGQMRTINVTSRIVVP